MTASPAHVVLTANTVATVTLDGRDFSAVEVLNVDGAAAIYFTADGHAPTVGGDGSNVLPAAIGGLTVATVDGRAPVIKIISSGTPRVSVRGVPSADPDDGTVLLDGSAFVDLLDADDNVVGSVPAHWADDQLPAGTHKGA